MTDKVNVTDDLKAIFGGGRITPINWGGDESDEGWNTWTERKQLAYAKELASAMNQAAAMLQDERDALLVRVRVAEEQAATSADQTTIFKSTLTEAVTVHNASRQSDAKIITELQHRVKAQDALIEGMNGDHD